MAEALNIVVLTGAGMSAESGIPTFRGAGGLWEGHRVEDVASPTAWANDPETVLRFYNERRRHLRTVQPNRAHDALVQLEQHHAVQIITQNVDDLHERSGSTRVLHLHGELMKGRSTRDPEVIVSLENRDIDLGDLCPLGSQLRPHIVWFGELVPAMDVAAERLRSADVLLVVGTSLIVYPAALLAFEAPPEARKILVDPNIPGEAERIGFECYAEKAGEAVPRLVEELIG